MASFFSAKSNKTFTSTASLLLRISFGFLMMIQHGWPKLSNFSVKTESFGDPLGIGSEISLAFAVFAEFFCALFVILGFYTRAAVIPLIITMLVAIFIIHGSDALAKKELGLLFFFGYTAILALGSGKYSIDELRK